MAKKKKITTQEKDGAYFLKLVLYFVVGSQWLWISDMAYSFQIPLPVGFAIGLLFAQHDHFQIDRKIEYAVLVVAVALGFWANTGLLASV